jgi:hypothetical protein
MPTVSPDKHAHNTRKEDSMKNDRSRSDEPVAPDDDHVDPPQSDDMNENEDFKPAEDDVAEEQGSVKDSEKDPA